MLEGSEFAEYANNTYTDLATRVAGACDPPLAPIDDVIITGAHNSTLDVGGVG
jgi:hypothetical protein